MNWAILQSVWPVLVGLAYLLATCVLRILAAQRAQAIMAHDRVRESEALRLRQQGLVAQAKAANP